MSQINSLVCHRSKNVAGHWRILGLRGELQRDHEVALSTCVVGVVEGHPAN
jgi:hypothetical protein